MQHNISFIHHLPARRLRTSFELPVATITVLASQRWNQNKDDLLSYRSGTEVLGYKHLAAKIIINFALRESKSQLSSL